MSLLNGPHTVLVFTKERVEDEMGYELVDRPPIRLTGVTVQAYFGQSGAIDEYPDGTQVRSSFKVFGRGHWPGGLNSVIRVENGTHAGREFDQDGELSLIHISVPTRLRRISYAVFCLKKKK